MIKQTLCSVLALSIAGCAFRTSPGIDEARHFSTEPTVSNKVAMYCPSCDEDYLRDYFVKGDENSRYKITYDSFTTRSADDHWSFYAMLPWTVVSILTLFTVIPAYGGQAEITVKPTLHDNTTGKAADLSPITMSYSDWFGGLLTTPLFGPFMYVEEDLIDSNPELFIEMDKWYKRRDEKASEYALKEAALAIYNPTNSDNKVEWKCEQYDCRYQEITAQKSVSADDVLWVAEHTNYYNHFEKVKQRLTTPLTTLQNCRATLGLVKNKAVSKETQRYWTMIDYYKANCPKQSEGIGMSKEKLIDMKGVPSKGYFMNDDTEFITYSRLSASGESVYTTTYTLDHDIVTSIK